MRSRSITQAVYTIHIEDDNGGKADRTFQFTDQPSADKAKHPAKGRGLLQPPGYPCDGQTVPGSGFYIPGFIDPANPHVRRDVRAGRAAVHRRHGQPAAGLRLPLPEHTAGSNYLIYITEWTSPPQTTTIANITVT